ncbi:MAG: hypothetical protein AVDCRST_MAG05-4476, partial [uncultured Rubrobacteraceae bacterium]
EPLRGPRPRRLGVPRAGGAAPALRHPRAEGVRRGRRGLGGDADKAADGARWGQWLPNRGHVNARPHGRPIV